MTTTHLVDPEIIAMLDLFPRFQFTSETLPQVRADLAALSAQLAAGLPDFPDIEVTEHRVPGPQGAPDARVLVYLPKSAPRPLPALLWIHGGGYVIGSADMDDAQVKSMVARVESGWSVPPSRWTTALRRRRRSPVRSRTATPP